MKIGYPCKNWTIGCTGDKTFRLKSYAKQRLIDTVTNNLSCLRKMLVFNVKHNILFFRITSDLIPFASHPICTFDWQHYFSDTFNEIGDFIEKHNMRISMHPDQFIVLNSPREDVRTRSIAELQYHADVLNAMHLHKSAKIQLHVGGVYNDKEKSMQQFIHHYEKLNKEIKQRLVIENDDTRYTVKDCLKISKETSIPVLLDVFHHSILNNDETLPSVLQQTSNTWKETDGMLMLDYSEQEPYLRKGTHAKTLSEKNFSSFLNHSKPYDFDIMLEIKDKEKSAQKAIKLSYNDERFIK